MKDKDFGITNELRGFCRFSSEILKLKNDEEMKKILSIAWKNFKQEQHKHPEDILSGWGFVEGMHFNREDPYYVGIGLE